MDSPAVSVLAVDLDNALLRSSLFLERFWSHCGHNPRRALSSAARLGHGRAAAMRHLAAEQAPIDVATLPYDEAVIRYIHSFRAAGGRTALVTASDSAIASRIADHLGIFDEVHGPDGTCEAEVAERAALLNERFGKGAYAYLGHSALDIDIWQDAGCAVTLNAPRTLRIAVDKVAPAADHLTSTTATLHDYLRALRPHQWLKNVLVFMPMLAAHDFTPAAVFASVLAFLSFSLVASSIYVLNDLIDLTADRVHPRKRHRPFAAGRIPIAHGTWLGAALLASGMAVALALGGGFLLVMLGYVLLSSAYSLRLKAIVIMDICVLAGLYTARIVAGGVATDLPLSVWILIFSMFFFFAMAAVKRQAELVDMHRRGKTNASGRGYNVDDLPMIGMMAISAGYVSVLVMALYVDAPTTKEVYSMPEILWGICGVLLYWITRTVMLAHRGLMLDDPVVYAAKDNVSRLCFVLILGFVIAATWL